VYLWTLIIVGAGFLILAWFKGHRPTYLFITTIIWAIAAGFCYNRKKHYRKTEVLEIENDTDEYKLNLAKFVNASGESKHREVIVHPMNTRFRDDPFGERSYCTYKFELLHDLR
jgi:hypothetical protein